MNIKKHYSERSYGYYMWMINLLAVTGLIMGLLGVPKGLILYGAALKYWYVFVGIGVFGIFIDDYKKFVITGLIGYVIIYCMKFFITYQIMNGHIGVSA